MQIGKQEFLYRNDHRHCPQCNHDQPQNAHKEPSEIHNITVDICEYCGFIYRAEWLAEDQWEQYYRQIHKKFPDPMHYSIREWTKYSIFKNYIPDTHKKEGFRHLDVGATRGKCLDIFGWKSTGIELCGDHYSYIRYFLKKDIRQQYDIGDGSFDVITMFNILNFHPNPSKLLEGYRDKLTKDGIILISVPVLDLLYVEAIQNYYALPLYSFFTIKTFNSLLRSVGLEIVMSTKKLKDYTVVVKRVEKGEMERNFDDSAMLLDRFNRTRKALLPAMMMDRQQNASDIKDKRKEAWTNVIKENPEFIEGALGLANVSLEEFGTVFQYVEEALKKWPDNAVIMVQAATLYRMHGMLDEALNYYLKANEKFWCYETFIGLAACYYDKGLFLDAMENYDMAVKINPMHSSDGVQNIWKKIEACCIAIKG